ncbi:MAG: ABC transporter permease [Bacillota bacterium]
MNLFQIAINNLRRRKGKALLAMTGLILGAAAVVSVYSLVEGMRYEMNRQLAELGANIVITPDTGALTFSYGGITVPELHFGAVELSEADLDLINTLPAGPAILALSPKIVGTALSGEKSVVVAGSDLHAEFAVKPWLHLRDEAEQEGGGHDAAEPRPLRSGPAPQISQNDLLLGAAAAEALAVKPGDSLEVSGRMFNIAGVLAAGGSVEDSQVYMDLKTAQELLARPGALTVIELAADFSLVPEQELLAQLAEALPHARVTSVRQAVMGRGETLSALARFGFGAAMLILISGLTLVTLTMFASVRERTRDIGIFRAIGFRSCHIYQIVCTEGVLISLAAGILGYHAGLVAAQLAGPPVAGTALPITWQPDLLALSALLTATAGGVVSLMPARLAAGVDPAEALRFY